MGHMAAVVSLVRSPRSFRPHWGVPEEIDRFGGHVKVGLHDFGLIWGVAERVASVFRPLWGLGCNSNASVYPRDGGDLVLFVFLFFFFLDFLPALASSVSVVSGDSDRVRFASRAA